MRPCFLLVERGGFKGLAAPGFANAFLAFGSEGGGFKGLRGGYGGLGT